MAGINGTWYDFAVAIIIFIIGVVAVVGMILKKNRKEKTVCNTIFKTQTQRCS